MALEIGSGGQGEYRSARLQLIARTSKNPPVSETGASHAPPSAKAPIVRFFDALERPILRQKEIGGFLAEHRTE